MVSGKINQIHKKLLKKKQLYEDLINSYNDSSKSIIDLLELNELAIEEKNQSIINEVLESLKKLAKVAKIQ